MNAHIDEVYVRVSNY